MPEGKLTPMMDRMHDHKEDGYRPFLDSLFRASAGLGLVLMTAVGLVASIANPQWSSELALIGGVVGAIGGAVLAIYWDHSASTH